MGKIIFRSVSRNLLSVAMPYPVDLCKEVGETVLLETMSGKNTVVNYIAQGKRSLSVKPNIGDRVPIHVSPGAEAIIAFSGSKMIDNLLDDKMERFTPNTTTDREIFKLQLNEVRQQGVTFCREEMVIGVNTMGAPILDHTCKSVAAVVIAGLESRVKCDTESPMVAALKKTAGEISAQIFHQKALTNRRLASRSDEREPDR